MCVKLNQILQYVFTDIFCIILVCSPMVVLEYYGVPATRGYFCNDPTVSYPDVKASALDRVLLSLDFILPCFFVSIVEIVVWFRADKASTFLELCNLRLPWFVINIYNSLILFFFVALGGKSFIDMGKYSLGSLRPYFLAICKPNITCSIDSTEYISTFTCLSQHTKAVKEARLSFPSDHVAMSTLSSLFVSFYFQMRLNKQMITCLISLSLISMTWCASLERISTYKHHPADVIVGFLLGLLMAVIARTLVKTRQSHFKPLKGFFPNNEPNQEKTNDKFKQITKEDDKN